MDKLEFPVATCPLCSVRGPVVIVKNDIVLDNDVSIGNVEVIICPECEHVINSNKDIEIEWFDIEQAKYFGYRVVDNG